ncbi:HAD family hydrolase [Lederbergia citri]|uniref:HAD family hydrolase n=1 Tax=Lederbergia citri TaxID=2833580 RepID=A0A942TFJ9_9BACI|nr:HAD family hydrolase [Lederbergia citri]MBS4195489.1 HAD family hydrolase [Lederbergia citri]
MKVIVFDLDDTLYDELTYVKSGFLQVATFLGYEFNISSKELITWMWERLQTHGRGAIFDDVLQNYGHYTKTMAKRCVAVYRTHLPNISLPQSTVECLTGLSGAPLYIVTDGNKIVQHNKLQALGLYTMVKHCYVTHRYGKHHAKPSPYCFLNIVKKEKIASKDVIYIGDNPLKDFVGIKPLGFKTIRIMTGQHKDIEMPIEYEADERIESLTQLKNMIENM